MLLVPEPTSCAHVDVYTSILSCIWVCPAINEQCSRTQPTVCVLLAQTLWWQATCPGKHILFSGPLSFCRWWQATCPGKKGRNPHPCRSSQKTLDLRRFPSIRRCSWKFFAPGSRTATRQWRWVPSGAAWGLWGHGDGAGEDKFAPFCSTDHTNPPWKMREVFLMRGRCASPAAASPTTPAAPAPNSSTVTPAPKPSPAAPASKPAPTTPDPAAAHTTTPVTPAPVKEPAAAPPKTNTKAPAAAPPAKATVPAPVALPPTVEAPKAASAVLVAEVPAAAPAPEKKPTKGRTAIAYTCVLYHRPDRCHVSVLRVQIICLAFTFPHVVFAPNVSGI
jgi:hypothetical protein